MSDSAAQIRARLRAIAAATLAVALLAAALAAGGQAPAAFEATVESAHDGDTIRVDAGPRGKLRVRLAGVDAPELAQPCGPAAREALAGLLGPGDPVAIAPVRTDRYGRLVAWVHAAAFAQPVNVVLVRQGYGFRYPGMPCHPHCEHLERGERLAREAKRGCWALGEPERPWDYRRRMRKGGQR